MNQPRPYRIVARIKNNRLWRAVCEIFPNVMNQAEAAAALNLNYGYFTNLLNMKIFPMCYGRWTKTAEKIANSLGHTPEYLFDPELYGRKPIPRIEIEIGPTELSELDVPLALPLPDQVFEEKMMVREVGGALMMIPPRLRDIIIQRFGLHGEKEKSLRELAREMNLSVERIRQMERQALMKLRHPFVNKRIREFIP